MGRETAMDARAWLERLGLGRYDRTFRDHRIDFDVLADLTDGDLEELGVALGDRRRLLRAIAELSAPDPLQADAAAGAGRPAVPGGA